MKNIGYVSADFSPMNSAASVRSSFFVDKLILEKHNVTIFTSVKNNRYNIIKNKLKLPTNKDGNLVRLLRELFDYEPVTLDEEITRRIKDHEL